MNWMDRRLAYDAAAVGTYDFVPGDYSRAPRRIYQGDFAVKELFEGWRLHFNVPNGIGDRSTTNMAISIWPDGMVEYSETFFARVETPMNLRRFPFDRQELEIFFHPFVYARDEVVLVADDRLARTWNQNLGIAQWRRESVRMTERPTEIAYFDESRQAVSEFVVILEIARRPAHVVVSIITPLIILVSLSWSVFWMDQASLTERINITFIGILSVVAYYFVVLDSVPEIAYLTLMDGFLLATFLLLAAGTIVNVVVDRLDRSERGTTGDRLDRACRWAFPLGYALITLAVVVYFFSY
ncbi:MAG: hypothetical protein QNK04_18845 [Myxococcota bacterium]|nr:hypothetical protein [Myxococcota bacterium]